LRCPSCRATFISLKGKKFAKAQIIQNKILNWGFNDIERIVYSTLGEPFASKLYMEVLQSLESQKYPQLKIILLTNGLLLTSAMWDSLHKIHQAIDLISVSIDAATEKTYKIVRIGGDFSKLLKNLKFIENLRKSNIIPSFEINFVVQKANYKEMKSFIGLGKKFNCDRIHFTSIQNIRASKKKEYSELAVHKKFHPEHKKLLKILEDPIFKDPVVYLDNLYDLSISSESALKKLSTKVQLDILFKDRKMLVHVNESLAEDNESLAEENESHSKGNDILSLKNKSLAIENKSLAIENKSLAIDNERTRNAFLNSRSWKITAFLSPSL